MSGPLAIVHAICTDAFAGAERAVTISAIAMAQRGHQVRVIGGDPIAMQRELAPHGVEHVAAHQPAAVARAIRKCRPFDVLHAHMTAGEAAALLSGTAGRSHVVVTRHFAQERGSSPLGRVVRVAMRRTPHTEIAISQFVARAISEPSTVVPFGLPDRPAVPLEGRTVVVIQRLEQEKDTATAVRAWQDSGLGDDGWRLVIAGEGAERPALEALAASLGVTPSVTFLGRVSDVDALRARASIQLTTARSEHFGLSVLEAMAVGLPVIATGSGAHPELLGDLGRYFQPGDVDGCAAALRTAAADDSWRRAAGAALRARQHALFSIAEHGRRLEQIYNEWPMLARTPRR